MGSFLLRISSKDSDSGYVLCGGKNTESPWDVGLRRCVREGEV